MKLVSAKFYYLLVEYIDWKVGCPNSDITPTPNQWWKVVKYIMFWKEKPLHNYSTQPELISGSPPHSKAKNQRKQSIQKHLLSPNWKGGYVMGSTTLEFGWTLWGPSYSDQLLCWVSPFYPHQPLPFIGFPQGKGGKI